MEPIIVIVWSCVIIFIVTAILTLLHISGLYKLPNPEYGKVLFKFLIVEIIVVSVAAFGAYIQTERQPPIVPTNNEGDINAAANNSNVIDNDEENTEQQENNRDSGSIENVKQIKINVDGKTEYSDSYSFELVKIIQTNRGPIALIRGYESLDSYYSHHEGVYPDSDEDLIEEFELFSGQTEAPFRGEWHRLEVKLISIIDSKSAVLNVQSIWNSGG